MQAIRTRYFGCTDSKGSRIQAKAEAGAIYVGYDHALNIEGNHKAACDALLAKLAWVAGTDDVGGPYSPMVGGWFDNDMYWVFKR